MLKINNEPEKKTTRIMCAHREVSPARCLKEARRPQAEQTIQALTGEQDWGTKIQGSCGSLVIVLQPASKRDGAVRYDANLHGSNYKIW